MPIYLAAPAHEPRGVDGGGHNRLAIIATPGDQCALRPKTIAAFMEAQDTRRATYGCYGSCCRAGGDCEACPRLKASTKWPWLTKSVVVRVDERGTPWVMHSEHRADGWGTYGKMTTWRELYKTKAGKPERFSDEHGAGLILTRIT